MLRDGHKLWDTLSFVCAHKQFVCVTESYPNGFQVHSFCFFFHKDNFAFLILFTVINSESCEKKKKKKKSLTVGGDNGSPGKEVHQAVKQLCKTKTLL